MRFGRYPPAICLWWPIRIPIFVASGYADDPVMAAPTDFGFTASICKPFLRAQLGHLLSKHLH